MYVGVLESNASVFVSLHPDRVSKWNKTKYSSQCVLCFCTSFFRTVSLYFDTSPVLNKFFEPLGVEFFNLLSEPFLNCMWSEYLCDVSWGMQKPEVIWCQILAVGRVCNNIKFYNFCHYWCDSMVGFGTVLLKKHPPPQWTLLIHTFILFRSFM